MKITETRKAIIELIEPYMDKTKSQFALVTHEKYDGEIQQLEMELDNYTDWFIKECKVIGHYDITAVLKYIDNSYRDERGIPWGDTLLELTPNDIHINIGEELYMLPNKPLNLYTDKEDKYLLDLLLKLK